MSTENTNVEEVPDLDFGIPLGACMGVVAYSNLDSYYFSGMKHFCQGVFTGYKYQCVEYARRHMLLRTGCIFGQCGPAHEIFDMDTVTSVVSGKTLPWQQCPNGKTKVKPQTGMTLVYPIDKKMPVGHVAVISEVGEDWCGIAEENEGSKPWNGKPYGRKVGLKQDPETGFWTMVEPDPHFVPCRGWLYIDEKDVTPVAPLATATAEDMVNATDASKHEQIYPKHEVKSDYVEDQEGGPKKYFRFRAPQLKPTTAGIIEESSGRKQWADAYLSKMEAAAKELGDKPNNASDRYAQYGLSGVARSSQFNHVYAPTMELGVAAISQTMAGFRVVESFVKFLFETKSKDEICSRYNLRPELYEISKSAFHVGEANTSAALSQVDFALGTMGLAYCGDSKGWKITHSEFDTLPYIIEINALQEPFVHQNVGLPGWLQTTFGYDFHRTIRNYQQFKLGNKKADGTLYAVDFGSAEEVRALGFDLPAGSAAEFAYEMERINQLYTIEYLKEVLVEKLQDHKNGDLPAEDVPWWKIKSVNFFKELTIKGNKAFVGEEEAQMIWKCISWRQIFALANQEKNKASDAGKLINSFIADVASTNTGVFQPAWTHIAQNHFFLADLATWAHSDKAVELEDDASNTIIRPKSYVMQPGDYDTTTGLLKVKIPSAETITNPTVNGDAYAPKNGKDEEGLRYYENACAQLHCLVAGGKRSAGIYLESVDTDKTGCCDVNTAVHASPGAMVRAALV